MAKDKPVKQKHEYTLDDLLALETEELFKVARLFPVLTAALMGDPSVALRAFGDRKAIGVEVKLRELVGGEEPAEDEKPAVKAKAKVEDEEEEKPKAKKPKADEEEEEEKPKAKKPKPEDEEEEEKPKPKKAKAEDEAEEKPAKKGKKGSDAELDELLEQLDG